MNLREKEEITLKVFRYDPDTDSTSRYETYKIPYEEKMTVLGALKYIQMNNDSSLTFRWGCRAAKCGQCGVTVNGKPVLACTEKIVDNNILIEPLSTFPVIRDLVIDREPINQRIRKNSPFLVRSKPPSEEPEPINVDLSQKYVSMHKCINCYL